MAKSDERNPVVTRRQELEQQLRNAPADRDGYLELARIYDSENQPLHAMRVLKQGHDVFPDDNEILWDYEEAQLKRSMQKLAEARKVANELKNPAADQELERATADWANCRIKVCRARIGRDDKHLHLRLVLGEALYDLERHEEAIEELEPLLTSDSHSSTAALMIGRCYLLLGQDAKAMKYLRAASLRRAVVAPEKVRVSALKLLTDLADRHGLTATHELYQSTLASITQSETQA